MEAEINIPEWATHIASDHTDMDRAPQPVDAGKVSSFRLTLPDDVYFEYAFIDAEGDMKADPVNELGASNPWYPSASAIVGPSYRPSPYAQLGEETARGSLERHRLTSERLDRIVRVNVYTPEEYSGQTLPLVLVFDGTAFLRLAGLPRVLEALVAEGEARPARLVFIEPNDRSSEYGFNDEYRSFILGELLPFLDHDYPVGKERIVLGASLGGLMSATLALLHPEEFGGVVSFSGAFLGSPEEREFYASRHSWVVERVRESKALPLRWYAEVGTIEWLTGVNRELHRVLVDKNYRHGYRERNAGHNWVNWRNGLADALRFALDPGA